MAGSYPLSLCSVKTEPPRALRGEAEGERLHLQWEAPSDILARHLIYEIRYRSKKERAWKVGRHFIQGMKKRHEPIVTNC